MELSFLELWRSTGAIARVVVGLLGVMSLAAGAVAIEKWMRLKRAERATRQFLAAWRADSGAPTTGYGESPAAELVDLVTAVDVSETERDDYRREIHDRTVRRHVLASNAELRRGLGVLATVGSTAPFVGLFGTVIGIINAFHEIGASGRGGVSAVSTGIAEALVTTAVGIMVAIPAVWLFNHLSQRIGRLLATVECTGEELAIARLRAVGASGAPSARGRSDAVPSWR